MAIPCKTCVPIDCLFPEDLALYSLDGLQFFLNSQLTYVFPECPPGAICYNWPPPWPTPGRIQPIRLRCCNKDIYAPIPAGATVAQINTILLNALTLCNNYIRDCGPLPPTAPRVKPSDLIGSGVPPRFVWGPLKGGCCLNDVSTATFAVISNYAPVTFSLLSGSLPPGTSLVTIGPKAGAIQGVATATGTYTFTVMADFVVGVSSHTYTVSVTNITNWNMLPTAYVGEPYSAQLNATGGTAPYTYFGDPDLIPDWMTVSPSGALSGTPTLADADTQLTFDVLVTDATGSKCLSELKLGVCLAKEFTDTGGAYYRSIGDMGTWSSAVVPPPFPHNRVYAPATLTGGMMNGTGTIEFAGTDSVHQILGDYWHRGIIDRCSGPAWSIKTDVTWEVSGGAGIELTVYVCGSNVPGCAHTLQVTNGSGTITSAVPLAPVLPNTTVNADILATFYNTTYNPAARAKLMVSLTRV